MASRRPSGLNATALIEGVPAKNAVVARLRTNGTSVLIRTGWAGSVTSQRMPVFSGSPAPVASSRPSGAKPTALTGPDHRAVAARRTGRAGSLTSQRCTVRSLPQASSRPSGLNATALTPSLLPHVTAEPAGPVVCEGGQAGRIGEAPQQDSPVAAAGRQYSSVRAERDRAHRAAVAAQGGDPRRVLRVGDAPQDGGPVVAARGQQPSRRG
nr:hypothetical protein GCM10020092_040810 [Actinoplanes digitatis]